MTPKHAKILTLLRECLQRDGSPLAAIFEGKTDDEIVRQVFANYRKHGTGQGLRLTMIGLQIMKTYFCCCEMRLPPGYRVNHRHVLYLDRCCDHPYFYSNEYLVVFDSKLGVMLKLCDGDIARVIEMDTDYDEKRFT